MIDIPFNKAFVSGDEMEYIADAIQRGQISGNGYYTKKCQEFFNKRYGFKKCLLTNSCTDALEMCALLLNIQEGDEVIMPSYTFVSTANAFKLRGARIIFADSSDDHPNIDPESIRRLITEQTKAIVVVHYGGTACDMEAIMDIAKLNNIMVIEDAAQSIDNHFKNRPLGSIGHLATFSFHATKNINSGEGGLLVINDDRFIDQSEIIWEKGTNRSAFFRGEVEKYEWIALGSSYLPSELTAAFLFGQLKHLDKVQAKRKKIWERYYKGLQDMENEGICVLPKLPEYSGNNAHNFYLLFEDIDKRNDFMAYLKKHKIHSVFHYLALHSSQYFKHKYNGKPLINCDKFTNGLLRLPLYYDLKEVEVSYILDCIKNYKF